MLNILSFVGGLALLVAGAELLVKGASRLAISLGLTPLVVGLTVVAFGTSAPEIAVSVGAVAGGQTDIAIGNVIGSNILNVLFILGLSALIMPLAVDRQLVRQEVPIMIGVTGLLLVMLRDRVLAMGEAGLLFGLLVAYTAFVVIQSRRTLRAGNAADEPAPAEDWASGRLVQVGLILGGLVGLVVGAQLVVSAAVSFARALGVSDLVVALTIVAAGTSLPEIATSLTAALKGNRDMAVGNVVGSNLFNILGCLGIAGLVAGPSGLTVAPSVMAFDAWVMMGAAVACLPIFLTGCRIARWEGAIFLAYYVFYVGYLVLAAEDYHRLQGYTRAMLLFVMPLTVLTALAIWLRPKPQPR